MVSVVVVGDAACNSAENKAITVKPVKMIAQLHLFPVNQGTLVFAVDDTANRVWNANFIWNSPWAVGMTALRLRSEGDGGSSPPETTSHENSEEIIAQSNSMIPKEDKSSLGQLMLPIDSGRSECGGPSLKPDSQPVIDESPTARSEQSLHCFQRDAVILRYKH